MKAVNVGLKQIPTTKSHVHILARFLKNDWNASKTWHKGAGTNITRDLMGHVTNKKSSPRSLKDKKIKLSVNVEKNIWL